MRRFHWGWGEKSQARRSHVPPIVLEGKIGKSPRTVDGVEKWGRLWYPWQNDSIVGSV